MTNPNALTAAEYEALTSRISNESVRTRVANELSVFKLTVETAIKAGKTVSLNDGEEWTVKRSTDVSALLEAAFTTDEDILRIHEQDGTSIGTIWFVYGNSAGEVIADYATSLEELLAPVTAYCDELMEKGL